MPGIANNLSSPNEDKHINKDEEIPPALTKEKGVLNPIDRTSEILFGLIMALSFTCTISVAEGGGVELRDLLFAALGCNIAWGLVDAVMYILAKLAERGRDRSFLHFLHKTKQPEKAREYISDALPPVFASALEKENLEELRKALLKIPEKSLSLHVTFDDLRMAAAIFLLVFLTTIPVTIPFVLISDVQMALRVSNLVAVVFMFICGWILARYSGYNKIRTGIVMTLIGILLVAITIVLGG